MISFIFLSHLCDGEVISQKRISDWQFLSHLCDGEVVSQSCHTPKLFLSHLCDGEALFWLGSVEHSQLQP